MTSPARITHADFERAALAAAAAAKRLGTVARVIYRLEQREIEIILGGTDPQLAREPNEWDDE